jgi:hypothetical protein
MAKGPPGSGAQIASQSLFQASAVANAIPVAGQFAAAGLAIAGLFTKIFGGRRRAKKEAGERQEQQRQDKAKQSFGAAPAVGGQVAGQGQVQQTAQQVTAPVEAGQTPAFSSYGGGSAPPVQQALNNYTGLKS